MNLVTSTTWTIADHETQRTIKVEYSHETGWITLDPGISHFEIHVETLTRLIGLLRQIGIVDLNELSID